MKKMLALSQLALCLVASLSAMADTKSIYGEDNRKDLHEVTNSSYLKMAKSTVAMISKKRLQPSNESITTMTGKILKSDKLVCEDVKFANQIASARCSGFLVSEDVIATAGHCAMTEDDCKNNLWVFDYSIETNSDTAGSDDKLMGTIDLETKNIYSCKKIIAKKLDNNKWLDYALIQLDRKVLDREPVQLRQTGKIEKSSPLVVIGNPNGLPTKIADNAEVDFIGTNMFFTNSDTFGGNSGSAVFNTKTEEVEGILVSGAEDYKWNKERKCHEIVKYDGEYNERVTKITSIPELKNLLKR